MIQETPEEAAEKLAMDKLKSKWEHLYIFGYPQKPFPTNYENDLNNVKVGLYEGATWQGQRMYSETEVLQLLLKLQQTESYDNLYDWFEQVKKK